MLSKIIDTLAIKESGLDSSIQNGQVSLPGYTLEEQIRRFSSCFKIKASVSEPEIEKANVQARVAKCNSHVFNLSNCLEVFKM